MTTKETVLSHLRSDSFCSGESLAKESGVSRVAVWKAINSLRAEGWKIVSSTNKGYKLESRPDKLDDAEIRAEILKNGVDAGRVFVFDSIDSTNNEAKRQCANVGAFRKINGELTDGEASPEELKSLHKLIKKVSQDIPQFSYNTSISAFMICVNELSQLKSSNKGVLKTLAVLIAPFAPHIAEELWERLGEQGSVCDAQWPAWDEQYLVESSVTLGVAFNGKRRFEMSFAADADNKTIEDAVVNSEQAQKFLEGKQIVKVIVVPKRMVNVVVK